MNEEILTSMSITGISGGVKIDLSGLLGTNAVSYNSIMKNGYDIVAKTNDQGVKYNTINVVNDAVTDPANFMTSVYYCQEEGLDEVDMEIEYKNIPAGSHMELNSSDSKFSFQKRAISGSNFYGKQAKDAGPLNMSMTLSLWFDRPEELTAMSTITLKMLNIEDSGSGPAKKTLLQQIVINLIN